MNLTAIGKTLARRVSTPSHGIEFTNGEPNRIRVKGKPINFSTLQQAIAAIREVEPDAHIDIESALEHLRNQ